MQKKSHPIIIHLNFLSVSLKLHQGTSLSHWLCHFEIPFASTLRSTAQSALQRGQTIPAGGLFVIGEEQDSFGGGFNPEESFYGDLSQLNVWNRVLTTNEIYDLARSCTHDFGNVIAWSDFTHNTHGSIHKVVPSLACHCKC